MRQILSLVILFACLTGGGMSTPPQPSISDVSGVWLGTAKEHRLLRMELERGGTGFICLSFPGNQGPYLYKIEAWKLEGFSIRLKTRPVGNETPPVKFGTIQYDRSGLQLRVDGERIDLLKDSVLSARSKRAQEEIQKQRDRE